MLKDLLRQRSNSPPSLIKSMLDQIIKGSYLSLHSAALLAQDIANLRIANKKIVKKRSQLTKRLPYEEGLTVEEGLLLATQLDLPVEEGTIESHAEVELPSQPTMPAARAPPRCSGC
jgi:hypothetical protein